MKSSNEGGVECWILDIESSLGLGMWDSGLSKKPYLVFDRYKSAGMDKWLAKSW